MKMYGIVDTGSFKVNPLEAELRLYRNASRRIVHIISAGWFSVKDKILEDVRPLSSSIEKKNYQQESPNEFLAFESKRSSLL